LGGLATGADFFQHVALSAEKDGKHARSGSVFSRNHV
jgi:hypothetical protein